jgi:hypothetical protein
MQNGSAQSAAVLDYATATPQYSIARVFRALVTVFVCMLLGVAVGWIVDPRMYRAVSLVRIEQTQHAAAGEEMLDANAVDARRTKVVAGVTAPGNVNAAVALLPPAIKLTPAQIAANLKVQPIPESLLIAVSYDDTDPQTAAAVAAAVVQAHKAPGITVMVAPGPPMRPLHGRRYLVAGGGAGLFAGVTIVALRWK